MILIRIIAALALSFGGSQLAQGIITPSSGIEPYLVQMCGYFLAGIVLCFGSFRPFKKADKTCLVISAVLLALILIIPLMPPLGEGVMAIIGFLLLNSSSTITALLFGGVTGSLLSGLIKRKN